MKNCKYIAALVLSILLFSCREAEKPVPSLMGTWKFIYKLYPKELDSTGHPRTKSVDEYYEKFGFRFFGNGLCQNRMEYDIVLDEDDWSKKRTYYLGGITNYRVSGDSLVIYDPLRKKNMNLWLAQLTRDTFMLRNRDSTLMVLVRQKPVPIENFDTIVVSSSGCRGTCPISDVLIGATGEMLFNGGPFNTKPGFSRGRIPAYVMRNLQRDFAEARIDSLNAKYTNEYAEHETISCTFIKNGKIVRTISDYGHSAPPEYYWAYQSARTMYQHVQLAPMKIPSWFQFCGTNILSGDDYVYLPKSEAFYLRSVLSAGKQVNTSFTTKYLMASECEMYIKIETDGRFFRINESMQPAVTIDVGYDFFRKNGWDTIYKPSPVDPLGINPE